MELLISQMTLKESIARRATEYLILCSSLMLEIDAL